MANVKCNATVVENLKYFHDNGLVATTLRPSSAPLVVPDLSPHTPPHDPATTYKVFFGGKRVLILLCIAKASMSSDWLPPIAILDA